MLGEFNPIQFGFISKFFAYTIHIKLTILNNFYHNNEITVSKEQTLPQCTKCQILSKKSSMSVFNKNLDDFCIMILVLYVSKCVIV